MLAPLDGKLIKAVNAGHTLAVEAGHEPVTYSELYEGCIVYAPSEETTEWIRYQP